MNSVDQITSEEMVTITGTQGRCRLPGRSRSRAPSGAAPLEGSDPGFRDGASFTHVYPRGGGVPAIARLPVEPAGGTYLRLCRRKQRGRHVTCFSGRFRQKTSQRLSGRWSIELKRQDEF